MAGKSSAYGVLSNKTTAVQSMWPAGTTWNDVKTAYNKIYPAAPAAPTPALQPKTAPGGPESTDPNDAAYNKQVTGLGGGRDVAIAGAIKGRDQTLGALGLKAQNGFTDDGGLNGSLVFDYSDPFSRASLLQREYMGAREQSDDTLAARGQARSGVRQERKKNLDFREEGARAGLTREATAAIEQAISSIGGARGDYTTGVGTALGEWAARQAAALRGEG